MFHRMRMIETHKDVKEKLGSENFEHLPHWWPAVKEHFKKNDKDIDWDYCVDSRHMWILCALAESARDDVFYKDPAHFYMDDMAIAVFKSPMFNEEFVVRTDLDMWHSVWKSIDPRFFFGYMWKSCHNVGPLYSRSSTSTHWVSQDDVRAHMNNFYRIAGVPEHKKVRHEQMRSALDVEFLDEA